MGSRAVLLVCRSPQDAGRPLRPSPPAPGAAWTRTGRPFFPAPLTGRASRGVREAAGGNRAVRRARHVMLLLDAELIPWNVKAGTAAQGPVRRGRRGRPPPRSRPRPRPWGDRRVARGLQGVGETAGPDTGRGWANRGTRSPPLPALLLGPPRAGRGAPGPVPAAPPPRAPSTTNRPHLWHLALADRLAAAGRGLITSTRRICADTGDPAPATSVVEELTEAGERAWWSSPPRT